MTIWDEAQMVCTRCGNRRDARSGERRGRCIACGGQMRREDPDTTEVVPFGADTEVIPVADPEAR